MPQSKLRTVDANAYSNGTCNIKLQRHVYGEVPYKKVLYLGVRDEAHYCSKKKNEINEARTDGPSLLAVRGLLLW